MGQFTALAQDGTNTGESFQKKVLHIYKPCFAE